LTNRKRKKAIRTCRCMVSFSIDSMGAADGACVGCGLVSDGLIIVGKSKRKRVRPPSSRFLSVNW